jgi:hypothetical protein
LFPSAEPSKLVHKRRDIRKAEKLARLLLSLDDAARDVRFRRARHVYRVALRSSHT